MQVGWSRWSVAALVFLLLPAAAQAFERSLVPRTEVCLFWEKRELAWSFDEVGSVDLTSAKTMEALQRSFDSWQAVDCSDLTFRDAGPSSSRSVGLGKGSQENLLLFRNRLCEDVVARNDPCWDDFSCANKKDCWSFGARVIAVTTTSFRESTGEIFDADIEFNESGFLFTVDDGMPCGKGQSRNCVSTDLQNTATHEIGHMIGLDHSRVPGSTMFESAELGEVSKRSLARDDIDGICSIYPAGQPVNVCEEAYGLRIDDGSGGCGCTSAAGGTGIAWLAAALGLIACRRRPFHMLA